MVYWIASGNRENWKVVKEKNLGFVTNKTQWSGHFRQAMREIPEEDYKRIMKIGK